ASISFEMRTVPELDKETLFAILDEFKPHSVVLLDNHSGASPQNEDARTISLLLYLRDYRESSGREFGITSEMRLGKNREIASATSPDDFIIGHHISGLLMAQIALDRKMRAFFECLLSSEGQEVYMKPARDYVRAGEKVELCSVIDAVAARGETFMGIQQKRGARFDEPRMNPPRFDASGKPLLYEFGPEDRLVILSEEA
ncbi:MAG: hypothetical protein IJH83_00150, partial [Coriobacteriales bacterium]|nr:hypothetical protein [Coriobacteriales bacterium]